MARLGRAQPFKPLSQGLLYEFLPHVFIKNVSATVSVAASRSSTVVKIASYIRAAVASVSVAAGRTSTATGGRTFIHNMTATVSVAAGRAATVLGYLNGFLITQWRKLAKPSGDSWTRKSKPNP